MLEPFWSGVHVDAFAMTDSTDYELDAHLTSAGVRGPLCDVRLWLPKSPDADARIEVTSADASTQEFLRVARTDRALVGESEAFNFRFEATDLLIRSAVSQIGRKAGGTRLTLAHVGTLRIASGKRVDGERDGAAVPTHITFRLSAVDYGKPRGHELVSYDGSIKVERYAEPHRLSVSHVNGCTFAFLLERHWQWSRDKHALQGWSQPALVPAAESLPLSVSIAVLSDCARDAALLLSLAARWRVAVYGWHALVGETRLEEWRSPLARPRAQGMEGAAGALVDPERLDEYFSSAAASLAKLDEVEREAIHYAILTMHPEMERTSEATFLAMFFALERLGAVFGKPVRSLKRKIRALHERFKPAIGGLWPITTEPQELPGLAAIRHYLAHGGPFSRKFPGVLSLAADHLQLWIEYTLLSILGFQQSRHYDNWLADQVIKQRAEVERVRSLMKGLSDFGEADA